ncbi:acyl carrier protein [Legionella oakridgensis]|uniref:Acyl carrier protein n=2 Tax=Legionella oakridgensis TaxID=29423 RepID=W0BG02_9GAMM|nr:acyl carrier protein [Legionella oakridgensis]AHE67631.1 acyl carrier protein [Legionella oakridgensis ATCC 33761 = DSM 21215]ETO92868.1 acyl carrier protein [Legionella oakridgensis RV-2-2007]KTD37025.1 acyl carrier protein [Legionella oakridgensis]STY20666.1 acyl carrier protein [Legionella longbeachae]
MKEKVLTIIQDVSKISHEKIDINKDLVEQGIDSLDMFDILFKLQEEFNIKISEESIANNEWTSISKIISQLNKLH